MQIPGKFIAFIRRQPRWRLLTAGGVLIAALFWLFSSGGKSATKGATFTAWRGPLDITVLEGGNLEALESQESKCEVRVGYQGTKILKIVEEGYLVTGDDVKTNKVLLELDSSELENQIVEQEIRYQSALASLTDAQQNYEIQLNQNVSDVKAAEQKVRFARMDFDKFLGDAATDDIVKKLRLDELLAAASTNDISAAAGSGNGNGSPLQPAATNASGQTDRRSVRASPAAPDANEKPPAPAPRAVADAPAAEPQQATFQLPSTADIDFSQYTRLEALGDGEAKQKLRKFEDDLQVARKELSQATNTLEGTRRLFEKGFVTRNDLQRDEIAYDNSRLKVQTAETARDLFLKYDFSKSAEEWLSKYIDAVRELDKTRRQAVSKLAQAEAKLKSAEGQFAVQSRRSKDLREQKEKCVIRADKCGLVVYGSGRREYYGDREPIREGATVRERQTIITIPDMTRMSVNVKIHESYIKKVKKGQKARITVDAYPDKTLTGEVTKVGVLPDSERSWMNPDLKVYSTTITIDGTHDWAKPGMSAKVEIMVNRLEDVVQIPVQAVSASEGKQVCYVAGGFKPERREVEIGEFNDEFIEIKSGLKEGERVLLSTPDAIEIGGGRTEETKPATSELENTANGSNPAHKPAKT